MSQREPKRRWCEHCRVLWRARRRRQWCLACHELLIDVDPAVHGRGAETAEEALAKMRELKLALRGFALLSDAMPPYG